MRNNTFFVNKICDWRTLYIQSNDLES